MTLDTQQMGGRAAQMSQGRQVYLFASVATSANPPDFNTDTPVIEAASAQPVRHGNGDPCERLWRVRTAGQCLQRFGEDLAPLRPNDFNSVAASQGGSGYFKARLRCDTSSGHSIFEIDVGQTLDLYCYKVDLDLLGPANTFEATDNNRGLATSLRTGLVIDARIGCSLLPIEESTANREAKLTQHLIVEANDAAVIPVPRSAVAVRIIQNANGVNSGDWTRLLGDPRLLATTFPLGTMVFRDRALLEQHWAIGDETHLQTDTNALVDRFFTLIWTIRP